MREDREGLAVLTLNRPERRNAMTPELTDELAAELAKAAARAFVITGAPPAFCVGADLKWMGTFTDPSEAVAASVRHHHQALRAMRACPVPVLTAVNGAAAGGGMSLALAGDVCLASPSASFTAAYFRLGLTPDGGNSVFLPALVGRGRAMELLLSNRTLSAAEAADLGLIGEVSGDPVARACSLAAGFATVPAETLATTRRLLDGAGFEAALEAEEAAVIAAAQRPEFVAALNGFLKRA